MRRIEARSGWLIALIRFSVALRRWDFVDIALPCLGLITGEGLILTGDWTSCKKVRVLLKITSMVEAASLKLMSPADSQSWEEVKTDESLHRARGAPRV